MCNLAGYIGERQAAPILLEMMQRQEGFAGGYYTGIATINEGQLHHTKVIGDVSILKKNTDAVNLPGTIGIIHGRSKSGGNIEWGHPFIDCKEKMAYIANGHAGFFEEKQQRNTIAQKLLDSGHVFKAVSEEELGNYPVLKDGTAVHASEVMCHLIEEFIAESKDAACAMSKAYMKFPAEIVGLMLHIDMPNCINASRINQPLVIGRSSEATYLATTAMAFPEKDIEWSFRMPTNSTAVVQAEDINLIPFSRPPGKVENLVPWHLGYERILQVLSDGSPKTLGALKQATQDLWPKDAAPQKDMMVYNILRYLRNQSQIDFDVVMVDGVCDGITAPQKRIYLIQNSQ